MLANLVSNYMGEHQEVQQYHEQDMLHQSLSWQKGERTRDHKII